MISPTLSRRMLLLATLTAIVASGANTILIAADANPGPLLAYVGTFSSPLKDMLPTQVDLPPGNGRGIHVFQVDRATGALSPRGVFETGDQPELPRGERRGHAPLFRQRDRQVRRGRAGTVSAFAIDRTGGQLTLLNTVSSGGAGPTYVSLHPSGRFLLVANYFGGSVAVLPILPDGRLGAATDVKKDAGTLGAKTATNAPTGSFALSGHDATHAHMIAADPSGRFVHLHATSAWTGSTCGSSTRRPACSRRMTPPSIALPPGDGPRHFAFHPNGRWFYSLQEEGSNIVLFDYDSAKGGLAARQTISSLPPGFAGSNFASEITVSRDGRFVYAGNRLHDSIACFAVGENGTLTFVAEEWTRGNYPRSFSFDPSGKFLYSCNQRADVVTTFRVDPKSGALAFTGQYTPVGNPSIIVFVDLAKTE